MYDQTTQSFTMKDGSGSYGWIWENLDVQDCHQMSDKEIYEWVDEHIANVTTQDTYAIDLRAKDIRYPVYGYTIADVFQNAEEYIASKINELENDMKQERDKVFSAIKEWIGST